MQLYKFMFDISRRLNFKIEVNAVNVNAVNYVLLLRCIHYNVFLAFFRKE